MTPDGSNECPNIKRPDSRRLIKAVVTVTALSLSIFRRSVTFSFSTSGFEYGVFIVFTFLDLFDLRFDQARRVDLPLLFPLPEILLRLVFCGQKLEELLLLVGGQTSKKFLAAPSTITIRVAVLDVTEKNLVGPTVQTGEIDINEIRLSAEFSDIQERRRNRDTRFLDVLLPLYGVDQAIKRRVVDLVILIRRVESPIVREKHIDRLVTDYFGTDLL
jgi:hypothetical protein